MEENNKMTDSQESQRNENPAAESVQPSAAAKKSLSPTAVMLLGLVSTIVVAGLIGLGIVATKVRAVSHNPTVVKVARIFHFPAASVDGDKISYATYIEDIDTMKRFYEHQSGQLPPVTDTEISDMTISRLVAYTIIERLAKEYNITVTNEEIEEQKKQLMLAFQNPEEAAAELQANYGWDLDTYIQKVIIPVIREQKLQEAFGQSTDQAASEYMVEEVRPRHIVFKVDDPKNDEKVKKQAQAVLERIKKGESFENMAKEFGADSTKDLGGDLGWVRKGQLLPEFENAIFAMEKGQLGDLVKTEVGYHIVRVDDKRQTKDFTSFMNQKISNADIKMYININDPFKDIKARLSAEENANTDSSSTAQ